MSTIHYPWDITFLAIIIFYISGLIIEGFVLSCREKIKKFVDNMKVEENSKDEKESVRQAELIKERDIKLNFITHFVSFIERFTFSIITIIIFYSPETTLLEGAKVFGIFLGGWLTLKILSNHKPWSDKLVGKAYYHVSLIGTLLNVGAGFIVGYLFFVAWLK